MIADAAEDFERDDELVGSSGSAAELAELVCTAIAGFEAGEPIAFQEIGKSRPDLLCELQGLWPILRVLSAMDRSPIRSPSVRSRAVEGRSLRQRSDSPSE